MQETTCVAKRISLKTIDKGEKMPKVSVIVPVYNVQDYVTKCLISLGEQTIDDLEVIIVNDGSTDDSKERIMNFLEDRAPKYKGKKFKYLEV